MTIISILEDKKGDSKLSLFQKRRDIRSSNRSLKLERWHFAFLRRFIRRHKKIIWLLLLTLVVQVLLEVGIFVYGDYIDKYLLASLDVFLARELLLLLLIGVFVYLASAFVYLWLEKSILVQLINELRERWFSVGLYRRLGKNTSFEKARLIAKLTYHFSLVQAGFSSTFSGSLRWLINNFILLFFCFFIDTSSLTKVLISLPVSVLLATIGYLIGKNYLSREASLSTAIITHIAQSLDKVGLLQNQNRQKQALAELDKMVFLDSKLKVRRNLWMEFGFKILFVLGVVGAAVITYIAIFVPAVNFEKFLAEQTIVSGLVLVYITRQLYLSLRVGLFAVPLKIGLALSLPGPEGLYEKKDGLKIKNKIEFISHKVKLTVNNKYLHNVNLTFNKGKSYLIYGQGQVGKTALSLVLAGKATSAGNPWIIKIDDQKYRYKKWCLMYSRNYYLPVNNLGSASIAEIISGRDGVNLTETTIKQIADLINKTPALGFIRNLPKYISSRADSKLISSTERHLLELASCLYIKPQMVVIDNIITDNNDPRITQMIENICSSLTESVIICLATDKNNKYNYEKTFKLQSETLLQE